MLHMYDACVLALLFTLAQEVYCVVNVVVLGYP